MWGWVVLSIFALLIIFILAVRVEFTVIFDKIWTAKIKILFYKKSFDLEKILNGVLFPPAHEKKEKQQDEKEDNLKKATVEKKDPMDGIKKIYEKDGVAGVIEFFQIICGSLSSAVGVLFRHFVIDVLDVEIVVAGDDAAMTARRFGRVAAAYYPFIGVVRNGMTVKKYKEDISADFLLKEGYEKLHFEGSICVMNLLGVVLVGAKTFLVNYIKSRK